MGVADVVLIDSAEGPDDAAALAWAGGLAERTYVVDLAWLRSAPWRERIAATFDPPAWRPELERITSPAPGEIPSDSQNPQLWLDLIVEKNAELALGSGTLSVTNGSDLITINIDSRWVPGDRDNGRDLYIGGERYQVAETLPATKQVRLDRAYEGTTDARASYAAGSVPFGAPWLVRIPTDLVILKENVGLLAQA